MFLLSYDDSSVSYVFSLLEVTESCKQNGIEQSVTPFKGG